MSFRSSIFSSRSEAASRKDHVYPGSVGRVGVVVFEDEVPRHLHARGGCHKDKSSGKQSTSENYPQSNFTFRPLKTV